jgi:hypothetical protein
LEACTGFNNWKEKSHMVDILHKVGIKSSSLDDTYKALTTCEGLSAWWTNSTGGKQSRGSAGISYTETIDTANTDVESTDGRRPAAGGRVGTS